MILEQQTIAYFCNYKILLKILATFNATVANVTKIWEYLLQKHERCR